MENNKYKIELYDADVGEQRFEKPRQFKLLKSKLYA